jgi:hypothetical protein
MASSDGKRRASAENVPQDAVPGGRSRHYRSVREQPGLGTQRVAMILREALGRDKISVAEVIRATGASKQRTYDLVNGDISPTIDEFVAICRHLGLDPVKVFAQALRG